MRRGRPREPHKHQRNIRLLDPYDWLLPIDEQKGPVHRWLSKQWPAGWSIIDPAENVKRDKWGEGRRSKRAAYGWTTSTIISHLLGQQMRDIMDEDPVWLLEWHNQNKYRGTGLHTKFYQRLEYALPPTLKGLVWGKDKE